MSDEPTSLAVYHDLMGAFGGQQGSAWCHNEQYYPLKPLFWDRTVSAINYDTLDDVLYFANHRVNAVEWPEAPALGVALARLVYPSVVDPDRIRLMRLGYDALNRISVDHCTGDITVLYFTAVFMAKAAVFTRTRDRVNHASCMMSHLGNDLEMAPGRLGREILRSICSINHVEQAPPSHVEPRVEAFRRVSNALTNIVLRRTAMYHSVMFTFMSGSMVPPDKLRGMVDAKQESRSSITHDYGLLLHSMVHANEYRTQTVLNRSARVIESTQRLNQPTLTSTLVKFGQSPIYEPKLARYIKAFLFDDLPLVVAGKKKQSAPVTSIETALHETTPSLRNAAAFYIHSPQTLTGNFDPYEMFMVPSSWAFCKPAHFIDGNRNTAGQRSADSNVAVVFNYTLIDAVRSRRLSIEHALMFTFLFKARSARVGVHGACLPETLDQQLHLLRMLCPVTSFFF